jgi:hypothetical protein
MDHFFLPFNYFGHNWVSALTFGYLLELLCSFLSRNRQIHQQLGFFLPLLGLCLVCAIKQLFRLFVVNAGNFEELVGRGVALDCVSWRLIPESVV